MISLDTRIEEVDGLLSVSHYRRVLHVCLLVEPLQYHFQYRPRIIPKKWGGAVEESMREALQGKGTQKETNKGLRMRGYSVRACGKLFKALVATMPLRPSVGPAPR